MAYLRDASKITSIAWRASAEYTKTVDSVISDGAREYYVGFIYLGAPSPVE